MVYQQLFELMSTNRHYVLTIFFMYLRPLMLRSHYGGEARGIPRIYIRRAV